MIVTPQLSSSRRLWKERLYRETTTVLTISVEYVLAETTGDGIGEVTTYVKLLIQYA